MYLLQLQGVTKNDTITYVYDVICVMQLAVYKPYGLTPKDVTDAYKDAHPEVKKIAFACRLDPMACGKMPLFTNEECVNAPKFCEYDKQYRFKLAFGFSTTSLDLMGFIGDKQHIPSVDINSIDLYLQKIHKNYIQNLPHYSSYMVSNSSGIKKPLWWWAKHKRLSEINVPSFNRKLYKYKICGVEIMTMGNIAQLAIDRISLVNPKHDFQQSTIIKKWESLLKDNSDVLVVEIDVVVSSGFYIRKLVEDIGVMMGVPTCTVEIERKDYFVYSSC